jgi:integrase
MRVSQRKKKTKHIKLHQISGQRAGYVFPALGSNGNTPLGPITLNLALKRVQRGMTHFTNHDLRPTGATRLSELGYQSGWIGKALNHKLRGVRPTTRVLVNAALGREDSRAGDSSRSCVLQQTQQL